MTAIEEVKDRLNIVDVVGESVKLKKSGKNYTGFCPFHPNTRTPAFVVFPDTGTWRCFGACSEGGDIFKFVMKKEGWDFPEALRVLAQKAGVELKPLTQQQEKREGQKERLRELLTQAVTYYRHSLIDTPPGNQAMQYLLSRGFTEQALESFEIGYAPASWDASKDYLLSKGFSAAELEQAGMLSARDDGSPYDRFRNRIMFPIRDHRGRMSGFGARILDPDDVPKFLNSPQTSLFDKGRQLYGMEKARKSIRSHDQAIIVEGYLDVMALHQSGYENAISPMGTALTEHQVRLIKRFSKHVVMALDADAAGEQATLRGVDVARESLDRTPDPVFSARGLVRYESRIDADIRIVGLPEGKDPDDVVLQDRELWASMLDAAQPIVTYVTESLLADQEIDDPKVKAHVARKVLPLIADVADPVEREAYRQNLARRLKVDERALLEWSSKPAARRTQAQPAEEPTPHRQAILPMERFGLGLLLGDPELIYRIDRLLHSLGMDGLSAKDFTGTAGQVIFQALRSSLAQDEAEPSSRWREILEEPALDMAEGFLEKMDDLDLSRPKVWEEIQANFLRLRKRSLETALTELQFELQVVESAEESDVEVSPQHLAKEVLRIAAQKEQIDKALSGHKGTSQETLAIQGW
jgi:DNA primase